jgi:hypothetical protein
VSAIKYALLAIKAEAGLEGTGLVVADAVMDGLLSSLSTASNSSAKVRFQVRMR